MAEKFERAFATFLGHAHAHAQVPDLQASIHSAHMSRPLSSTNAVHDTDDATAGDRKFTAEHCLSSAVWKKEQHLEAGCAFIAGAHLDFFQSLPFEILAPPAPWSGNPNALAAEM